MTDRDPTQPLETPPAPAPAATAPPLPAQPAPSAASGASWAWGQATPPASPPPVRTGGLDVPVALVGARPRGRNPLRWLVAVLVVALVVAGGLGATLLLTSSTSGTSAVLGYVPADTLMYGEARLDLPGSQRAEVAKSLSAFPGFADQASLDSALGELYDRILKAASSGKHDYQTEIAPWFGGQLAVARGPQRPDSLAGLGSSGSAPSPAVDPTSGLPPCTGGAAGAAPTPTPTSDVMAVPLDRRYMVLADVTNAAKAGAWVASILAETGTQTIDGTCDGVVVHVLQPNGTGWAILGDKVLVAGDLTSIRLAIATHGTGGLSTTPSFAKAVSALQGDHVGFMYADLKAALSTQLGAMSSPATDATLTAISGVLGGLLPDWMAADLKAAGGNVVVDTVQPASDVQPTQNRASDLAGLAPANTIALGDVHDLGTTLGALKDKFAADPTLQPFVKQLDTAIGLVGGFAGTVGWIGDAGFAITSDGSRVSGGVLIRPGDADAAARLFTQLRSLAELAGAQASVADEPYRGATISTVDLSALAPLLESSMPGSLGGMTVPSHLTLAYAATDKVVVLTLDPAFAKAAIDASLGGDSLAKRARFSSLLAQAGDTATGLAWLDVTATRGLIEGKLPPDQLSRYVSDIKPYLLPLDAVVGNTVYDNGLNRGTMVVSINH